MERAEIKIEVITPSEGKYLTQMNVENERQRAYSKKVFLGVNDTMENWREADEAEKTAWEEQERERIKAEEEAEREKERKAVRE